MYDVLRWFVKNWEVVLSVLLFIASLIIALIKKKPVLNKVAIYLNELYERIPVFIDLVEKNGHGAEKKALVLELCKQFLEEEFGFYDFDVVKGICSNYIESVLITPQKKLYNFDDEKED